MAPTKPIITALVGEMLLQAAVAETQPDMIEPTRLIRSNLRVMFWSFVRTLVLVMPIMVRNVAEPTAERMVLITVSCGMFLPLS